MAKWYTVDWHNRKWQMTVLLAFLQLQNSILHLALVNVWLQSQKINVFCQVSGVWPNLPSTLHRIGLHLSTPLKICILQSILILCIKVPLLSLIECIVQTVTVTFMSFSCFAPLHSKTFVSFHKSLGRNIYYTISGYVLRINVSFSSQDPPINL